MIGRPHVVAVGAACLVLGSLTLGEQVWLGAKAVLADHLVDRAFVAHLRDGSVHRPWSWADTYPLARLEVTRLGVRRIVLAGASGSSLAFGPGHVDGTAAPNADGNCVLAGHRDGSFAFLERLLPGDVVSLRTRDATRLYEVVGAEVRSMWDAEVTADAGEVRLTLVTCYPFDGWRGSTQRYVVTCRPIVSPGRYGQVRPTRSTPSDPLPRFPAPVGQAFSARTR